MLKIYDTNTRKTVDFKPLDEKHIKMYVCGPTVYDYIHIGNARPIVIFDVLYRLLSTLYPKVTYVRNITDVDDKINARAKENGETISELTARTEKQFLDDADALGSLHPDVQPRATEHVPEMVAMIKDLIKSNNAYAQDGHALFSVKSWNPYGKFAKKDYDEQVAGARVEVASYKKDPADFVLWKPSRDDEPGWDSPWGRGRPGWHIECSAMAKKHLGNDFDIHGGGLDLIFPHHQNEIAQSCCANKDSNFATYWMHNGFLMSEGEKMSKSIGNFYSVRELLQDFDGLAIRLVLLSTHYTKPLDFTKDKLVENQKLVKRIRDTLEDYSDLTADNSIQNTALLDALKDDLNTPLALSKLWDTRKDLIANPCVEAYSKFVSGLELLGLSIQNKSDDISAIEKLAEKRKIAKKEKDFATADTLRDTIKSMGYEVLDTPDGYKLRKL